MSNQQDIISAISRETKVKYSDEQLAVLNHDGGMCILACAGSGKALPSDSLVATERGYVEIGSLKPGDTVFGVSGQNQLVEGVFPQGYKERYEVKFSDGNIVPCCIEHLWTFCKQGEDKWETKSLSDIIVDGYAVRNTKGHVASSWNTELYVPINNELAGMSLNAILTEEVIAGEVISNGLVCKDTEKLVSPDKVNIESLGLTSILGSVYNRWEFITNLVGAAGTFDGADWSVKTKIEAVAKDVQQIAESLGFVVPLHRDGDIITVVIKGYSNGVYYTDRVEVEGMEYSVNRAIVEIKDTGMASPMTCIKVSNKDGLFLTEHCIATHNTTILTHLLAKRIKSGEIEDVSKMLCTTFSKSGATEMEERLGSLLEATSNVGIKPTGKVQVKTLHATYYHVLRHFGMTRNIMTNSQRAMFISKAVKEARVSITDEDMQLIDSLLSYQINNLLDDAGLVRSYVYTLDDLPQNKYTEIRARYNQQKDEANLIDFDDLQLYMYLYLAKGMRPDILKYCRDTWNYFFVDEFQDVSKIQFEILRTLITDPNRLIVIGDDDQCIYQWRGANPDIILNICGYYDIKPFVLSTNYRCGGEIVKHAAVGIKHNSKRSDKSMIPFNDGGEIKICDCDGSNLYKLSKPAVRHIIELIKTGVSPSDIAVLSRNNQHLTIVNNMLLKAGVYVECPAEMRFTSLTMYKDIKDILTVAKGTYDDSVAKRLLWKICKFLGVKGGNLISRFMSETKSSLNDALGYMIKNYSSAYDRITWSGKLRLPEKVDDNMRYQFNQLKYESVDGLVMVFKILQQEDVRDRIYSLMVTYITETEFMYKSRDKARTVEGLVEYIRTHLKEEGLEALEGLLALTEQYENGKVKVPVAKVTLSTAHSAKGREWKHVILFADDTITFPSIEGIAKMTKDGVSESDIRGSIDENRRLHYVAFTRAKVNLTIFADTRYLSIYTLETLGLFTGENGEKTVDTNDFIMSMVANEAVELPKETLDKVKSLVETESSPYYYRTPFTGEGCARSKVDTEEDKQDGIFDYSDECSESWEEQEDGVEW